MESKLDLIFTIKYSIMLKKLSIVLVALTFAACQGDSPPEDAQQGQPPQGQQQQPGQQGQLQQPADVDVSDEELDTFIDALVSAQEVQMEFQQEMMAMIEEEGLDVDTFNKIAQAEQMGQSTEELDVSDEDMQNFENVSGKIQEAQADINEEVTAAVEDAGMEMSRFEEINQALQQDSDLQQRTQEKMQEMQPQQGQPQQ